MDSVSGHLEAPWSGFGQLDTQYRSLLGLPDSAVSDNMAELLAEAALPGSSGAASLNQQLNGTITGQELPPVIDFSEFFPAQQAEQPYLGLGPTLDDHKLPHAQPKLPEIPPRGSRRATQPKPHPCLRPAGNRQVTRPCRISSTAQSQPRSLPFADQSSHSPDASSHSDSDFEAHDGAAGGDPDFAPVAMAKEAPPSGPKDSKAKLREKNKRAQKRFRARQKDRAQQSERLLAEMAAQMQQLRVEKEELQGRNLLLEDLLKVQQQQQHDSQGAPRLHASQEMEALLAGTGPLSDSLRRNDPYHPPSLVASPSSLAQQAQHAQQAQEQQQQQNQSQQQIKVSLLPGSLKFLSPTQVKELSWQNHLKLYKAYVARLASLLQLSNGNEDSQAGKQVEGLVIESVRLAAAKALLDPVGLQQVFQARMRDCRIITQRTEPLPDMWPNILDALHLSRQQVQELMALRRVFLPKMGQLLRDRQRISRALQDSQLRSEEDLDPDGPCQQYTDAPQVLRDLQANLQADKTLLMQVLASIWRKIMRPYQLATVVVMAHPWVPDTGPILDLVAQAEGEPRAEALMGIDRVPGTRGIGSWTLEWTGTFASSLTTTPVPSGDITL